MYYEHYVIDDGLNKRLAFTEEDCSLISEPEQSVNKKEQPTKDRWGRIFKRIEDNIFLRGKTYLVRVYFGD